MRNNNNNKLRALVAVGGYHLAMTAAARSEMEQAHPPADRVTYRNYTSGHMLYLGKTAEAFAQVQHVPSFARRAE